MENLLNTAIAEQDYSKVIQICDKNLKEIGDKHNIEDYLKYSII